MKWRKQKQSLRSILRNVIPIGNSIFNEQGAIRERDREGPNIFGNLLDDTFIIYTFPFGILKRYHALLGISFLI